MVAFLPQNKMNHEFYQRTSPERIKRNKPIFVSVIGPSGTGKSELGHALCEYEKYSLPKTIHLNTGDIFRLLSYYINKNLYRNSPFMPNTWDQRPTDTRQNPFLLVNLVQLRAAMKQGEFTFIPGKGGMHCFERQEDGSLLDIDKRLQSKGIDMFSPAINSIELVQAQILAIRESIIKKLKPKIVVIDARTPIPDSDLILFLAGSPGKRAIRKIASRQLECNKNSIKEEARNLTIRDKEDRELIKCPKGAWLINTDKISIEEIASLLAQAIRIKMCQVAMNPFSYANLEPVDRQIFNLSSEETAINPLFHLAIANNWPFKQKGRTLHGKRVIRTTITIGGIH